MQEHQQEQLLLEQQVADILNVSVSTLQKWRSRRTGPPFIKLPSVRYRPNDVRAYLESKLEETTRHCQN
jgi:predicted DNA-binding transcriptional regulator AlpA